MNEPLREGPSGTDPRPRTAGGSRPAAPLLIEGKNLTREFRAGGKRKVHAVSGVSLGLAEGETLGLAGESGCGKSTLGRLLIRTLEATSGEVLYRGRSLTAMPDKEFAPLRRRFQMVFQDPYASLDPRMTVRNLIAEPLETWRVCPTKAETTLRVLELMRAVGIPEEFLERYPHQFSGGQRQRIGIARAIALDPEALVLDEPVSALDVSVQNQILNLMTELKKGRKLTCLFISHDLSVLRHVSDRIAVMFLGKICEMGPTQEVYARPMHPYTAFLLSAVPKPDPREKCDEAMLLRGELPSPISPPEGCRFHTRCPFATRECALEEPEVRAVGTRRVACHHPL